MGNDVVCHWVCQCVELASAVFVLDSEVLNQQGSGRLSVGSSGSNVLCQRSFFNSGLRR